MAHEIERRIGDRLADAIAVIPKDSADDGSAMLAPGYVNQGAGVSHPVPDESSEEAARLACEMLHGATADDLVIVAISGGASAMFVRAGGGTHAARTRLRSIRRCSRPARRFASSTSCASHLSAVKGGRLLHHCGGARVLGLILSDVPGNDLATIGSGLTAGDWSSFGDAVSVLKRRSVWGRAPEAVRSYLERAVAGEVGATVKTGRSDSRARDQRDHRRQQSGSGRRPSALRSSWGIIRSDGKHCMARPTTRAARWRSTCARSRMSGCASSRAASRW